MAKNDRCSVCDFTSMDYPNAKNKVRRHEEDMLCDECVAEISQNLADLSEGDEDDDADAEELQGMDGDGIPEGCS